MTNDVSNIFNVTRRKFWVGVASKDHVENFLKLGICQFCHGKLGTAKRLSKGDFVIYCSSKDTMEGSEPYQKFTAVGIVTKVLHAILNPKYTVNIQYC